MQFPYLASYFPPAPALDIEILRMISVKIALTGNACYSLPMNSHSIRHATYSYSYLRGARRPTLPAHADHPVCF